MYEHFYGLFMYLFFLFVDNNSMCPKKIPIESHISHTITEQMLQDLCHSKYYLSFLIETCNHCIIIIIKS